MGRLRTSITRRGFKKIRRDSFGNAAVTPFDGGAIGSEAPFVEATRQTPVRAASLVADVLVPIAQAFAFGFCAALLVSVLVFAGALPWYAPFLTLLVVTGIAGIGLLLLTREALQVVEKIVERDLNHDGFVGKSQEEQLKVTLEVVHKNEFGHTTTMYLPELAKDVADKLPTFFAQAPQVGLAESYWTGSSGLFSISQFKQLIGALEKAKIVEWKNPDAKNQGRKFTLAGEEAVKKFAQNS